MPIPDWLRDELAATPDPVPVAAVRPVPRCLKGHPLRFDKQASSVAMAMKGTDLAGKPVLFGCRVCWLLERPSWSVADDGATFRTTIVGRKFAARSLANRVDANAWGFGAQPQSIQDADRDEQRERDGAKIDIPDGTDAEVVAYARRYIEGRGAAGPVDGAREWHRTIDKLCRTEWSGKQYGDIVRAISTHHGYVGPRTSSSVAGWVDIEWPQDGGGGVGVGGLLPPFVITVPRDGVYRVSVNYGGHTEHEQRTCRAGETVAVTAGAAHITVTEVGGSFTDTVGYESDDQG